MLASICIFMILLFIYVHIRYHIRPGTDSIIYELNDPSRELLHDTIHHKQPVKFTTSVGTDVGWDWGELLKSNTTREVTIGEDKMSVSADKLVDVSCNQLIQSNHQFINDIGLNDAFALSSHIFRPHMMTRVTYDLIGNHGGGDTSIHTIPTTSPAHITYLVGTSGSANIRLCSGKYTNRLCKNTSFSPLESHLSFWDNSGNLANEELFVQIETLDTILTPGNAIAIPAHWWYSMELSSQTNVAVFTYRSIMNEIACLPETVREVIG